MSYLQKAEILEQQLAAHSSTTWADAGSACNTYPLPSAAYAALPSEELAIKINITSFKGFSITILGKIKERTSAKTCANCSNQSTGEKIVNLAYKSNCPRIVILK